MHTRRKTMDAVKVWEEKVVIPTYEVGEADKNPNASPRAIRSRVIRSENPTDLVGFLKYKL